MGWNFRVWRGKGTPSPAQLGLKLVRHLLKVLAFRFQVTISGLKKTAKHRFGLPHFGQGSLLGMYRWLILSLIAY